MSQSAQSVPDAHALYSEPGPLLARDDEMTRQSVGVSTVVGVRGGKRHPSSQSPSDEYSHVLLHSVEEPELPDEPDEPDEGGEPREPQSKQSVPCSQPSYSAPDPLHQSGARARASQVHSGSAAPVRSTQAQEQARVSARGLGRRSRTRHRSHRLRSSCRCWCKSHLDSSSRSNHCLQSRTCTQPLGRCVHGEGKAREVRGHSSERVAAA